MTMFALRGLSVLAYASGFTLWHYRAPCPLEDLDLATHFAPAADMLSVGDMMLTSTHTASAMLVVLSGKGAMGRMV